MNDYYPNTGGYSQDWQVPKGDPYDVEDNAERYIGDETTIEDFDESNNDSAFNSDEEI